MPDPIIVTAADGRAFTLRDIGPMEVLDLLEAAEQTSGNKAWLQYAWPIVSVAMIDGHPRPFPRSRDDLRRLAAEIGTAGHAAITEALFPKDATAAPDVAETAKN